MKTTEEQLKKAERGEEMKPEHLKKKAIALLNYLKKQERKRRRRNEACTRPNN